MEGYLPIPSHEDLELLATVNRQFPDTSLADLSVERLAEIAVANGIDFATAPALTCVRRDPQHEACTNAIMSYLQSPLGPRVEDAAFCLVPNLGYFDDPKSQQIGEGLLCSQHIWIRNRSHANHARSRPFG